MRRNFSAKLEKVINQDRCRENNWSCDPERFTSDLDYPMTVDDRTKSLAFGVRFSPEGFVSMEEFQDSGVWDDDLYVYVFQLEPFRWREFLIYDLKPKFGTDSLQELISPKLIEKVFATPAPN